MLLSWFVVGILTLIEILVDTLKYEFTGLENSTCVPKPCTVTNNFTGDEAISGKIVAQQLPSRPFYSLSDGASATEGGSLFHRPTLELRMLLAIRRV